MTDALKLVEQAIAAVLKPVGFRQRKLLWWRECGEFTQVVALDKMTYGAPHYNFCCGLVIERFKFPHIPRVAVNGLNVDWQIAAMVTDEEERSRFLAALQMDTPMEPVDRAAVFKAIVENYCLQVFSATDTIERLRMVLSNRQHPFYTSMTTFLLEEL